MRKIAWVLVIVGALNWGLVGVGWLLGGKDWNLVHFIFGKWMTLEAIIYVLVGLGAIKFFFCNCSNCKAACTCGMHGCGNKKMDGGNSGAPKMM